MRIISWNVNGIRATHNKWELANLILTYDPDMIFLQEIKAELSKIPLELISPMPYMAYYNPAKKPGYAGTGVWIHERILEKYEVRFLTEMPGDPNTDEWRIAHAELTEKSTGKVLDVFGIYFPNGGKSEDAWQGKLVFYKALWAYIASLRDHGHAVLWWGDINCAHHEIDLARPKANDGKIGFHPLERSWLDSLVADGWHDIWRGRNPHTTDVYSWWDVITRSRATNVGWRIDAWWGNSSVSDTTKHIEYLTKHMGSDHCPILIDISL